MMRPLLFVLFALAAPGLSWARAQDASESAELVLAVSAAGEEEHGGRPLASVRTGQLRQGGRARLTLRLPASACVLALARGGEGTENLDVVLRRGRTALARDARTDARAEARHCAGSRPERLVAEVRAFRGSGAYALGVYRVEAATETAGEVSGETPLRRLEALHARAGGDYVAITPPRRETLAQEGLVERPLTLQPGRCYRILAAAEDALGDVDLVLHGPGDARLQSDGTQHGAPTLGVLRPLCPASPGSYRLRVVAADGAGVVAWRAYGAPLRSGAAHAAMAQAASAEAHRVGGDGDGYIAGRLRRRHRERGEGRAPVTDLITGTLRRSELREVPVPVRSGRCYVAIAAGVPSARHLGVQVVDAFGQERGRSGPETMPAVRFCPSVSGRYAIRVKMELGYGEFGLQIFGGPR